VGNTHIVLWAPSLRAKTGGGLLQAPENGYVSSTSQAGKGSL